jgi:hypothetical protein
VFGRCERALHARILDISFEAGQWTRGLAVLPKTIRGRTSERRRLCVGNTPVGCGRHGAGLFPGAQLAAEQEQFAKVVGVVIGQEEGFAQNGLAVAVGQRGEKVR